MFEFRMGGNVCYWSIAMCFTCSKYQQLKIAKYCEEMLDEYLLRRPLDGLPVSSDSDNDHVLFHPGNDL